jgi:hypothetical protein
MADPYVLLGMLALLPLLESIDSLVAWAQKRDVYICDFVGTLQTCQQQLFTYYKNSNTKYQRDDFHAFNLLLECNHESILLKWDQNLNLPCEQLAFVEGGDHVLASHDGKPVTREVLATLVEEIKEDCSGMSSLLICFILFYFKISFNCNLVSSLV